MKVSNLDLLVESVGRVVLFGEEHDVLPLDGDAYRALYELEEGGNSDVRPLLAIAARIVPSLSAEKAGRLVMKQVGAILAIAGAPVQAVEQSFPNSDGAPATNHPPTSPE